MTCASQDIYAHRVAVLARYKGVEAGRVHATLGQYMQERGWTVQDTMLLSGEGDPTSDAVRYWAQQRLMGIYSVKPNWSDLTAKGAIVKKNDHGEYNATAWMGRDRKLISLSTHVLVFWDGRDQWLSDMMDEATALGKIVTVEVV